MPTINAIQKMINSTRNHMRKSLLKWSKNATATRKAAANTKKALKGVESRRRGAVVDEAIRSAAAAAAAEEEATAAATKRRKNRDRSVVAGILGARNRASRRSKYTTYKPW
jgi:hypothetical protein